MDMQFDALESLRTEGMLPPNPRVRPLDNLHKCRRVPPAVSLSISISESVVLSYVLFFPFDITKSTFQQ